MLRGASWAAVLLVGCPVDSVIAELQEQDAGSTGDAARAVLSCDAAPDATTLALYRFDDLSTDTLRDASGAHDGSVDRDTADQVPGPPGCGMALAFRENPRVIIPDSEAFDLEAGSIDFYLRHDGRQTTRGVLSRDALSENLPGHFTLHLGREHRLTLRIQGLQDRDVYCAEGPLDPGRWHRIGISFGAPGVEIRVDGVVALRAAEGVRAGHDCSRRSDVSNALATAEGDNNNPWYLGSSRERLPEGRSDERGQDPFVGGAIDHLHIRRERLPAF